MQRFADHEGSAGRAADSIALRSLHAGALTGIVVPTRFPGTLIEAIRESDLRSLFDEVARAAGAKMAGDPRRARLAGAALRPLQPTDSLSRYAELLARLTDTYAASGDESPTRDVVHARLPAWARDQVTPDSAGNLILAIGPDRDTVVFIAHMDEVGFAVVRANVQSGTVTLRQLGGFYPWLFTGQPALLHVSAGLVEARWETASPGCDPSTSSVPGHTTGAARQRGQRPLCRRR